MQDIREIKIELIQIQIGLDKLKFILLSEICQKEKEKTFRIITLESRNEL